MSAFDEFADQVLEPILWPGGFEEDLDDLRILWDNLQEALSYNQGYTLRPDDPRYPEDRILIEDTLMDLFGYDPDWREA